MVVNQSQELTGSAARLCDLWLDGTQGFDESTIFGALGYLQPASMPTHHPSAGSLRRRSRLEVRVGRACPLL